MSPASPNVGENLSHAGIDVSPAWKKELNERLAATRTRRLQPRGEQAALPGMDHLQQKVESRASRLAAKVAQRYANAPSYSEVFAAAARRQEEMAEMAEPALAATATNRTLSVEQSGPASMITEGLPTGPSAEVLLAPPEEAAFAPAEPLGVNLIEFPRELVAARKLRPRLAEGPLRAASEETESDQLKIFDRASESISRTVKIGSIPANWSPIRLDTDPVGWTDRESVSDQIPLKTASLEDRLMAGIFDLALIFAAFAIFVLVFVACTAHPPTGKAALLGACLALAGLGMLYQYLFFKFAEGTPGMRYAKIALCTFDDENPTRQAMCRRIWLMALAAAPLGLGFIWACFDPDRLGWHDRMSRIYQRSYS